MAIQARGISFVSDRGQLTGYIAVPEGAGPFPGIVVIHEIFGLNDNYARPRSRLCAAQLPQWLALVRLQVTFILITPGQPPVAPQQVLLSARQTASKETAAGRQTAR